MEPKLRSLIIALAILFALAAALSTSIRPVAIVPQNLALELSMNHVFQTTNTTSTTSTNGTAWHSFFSAPVVAFVKTALTPYIGNPPQVPSSTLFTLGIAVVVSLVSATTGKLLVDYDMIRQNMREFQAYQRDLNKAKKEKDEATLAKLMKKQQAMVKLQGRSSMEQMKVTAVTFVPFLVLWYTMSAVFGGVIVANAPWPILQPLLGSHLIFYQWYLVCNFATSLPIFRIFGISMTDS